jgi:hypothetical protein
MERKQKNPEILFVEAEASSYDEAVFGMWWGFALAIGSISMLTRATNLQPERLRECVLELKKKPSSEYIALLFRDFVRIHWGLTHGIFRIEFGKQSEIIVDRLRRVFHTHSTLSNPPKYGVMNRLIEATQVIWLDCERTAWSYLMDEQRQQQQHQQRSGQEEPHKMRSPLFSSHVPIRKKIDLNLIIQTLPRHGDWYSREI